MSERKWTPGPWRVIGSYYPSVNTEARDLKDRRTYGYGCGNDFICDLNDGEYHEYSDLAEQAANAHLIAAAPDLYEALEAAFNHLDYNKDEETYMMVHEALSKARGETQ